MDIFLCKLLVKMMITLLVNKGNVIYNSSVFLGLEIEFLLFAVIVLLGHCIFWSAMLQCLVNHFN